MQSLRLDRGVTVSRPVHPWPPRTRGRASAGPARAWLTSSPRPMRCS